MKPFVVYVEKDGTLDINKERLEYLLKEAYEQGYADGKASQTWSSPFRYDAPRVDRTYITCDSNIVPHTAAEYLNNGLLFSDNSTK